MHAPDLELKEVGSVGRAGYVRWAFMFQTIAITVQHSGLRAADGEEVGVRVEIQRLEEHWGADESEAVELRIFDPIFRADLFSLSRGSPGNFDRAHYHPSFNGRDPGERVFAVEFTDNPIAWLREKLSDLGGLLETAGRPELVNNADSARVAAAVPSIVEAVTQFLDSVP